MHIVRYRVEIWAGSGSERWNPQAISLMASSAQEAREIVADELHLKPEQWQGDDPPLALVAVAMEQEEACGVPRPARPRGDGWRPQMGVHAAPAAIGVWGRGLE